MKIVVIGGTGLIGGNVVAKLKAQGHFVVAAAPATGVNTITGAGLAEAMADTDVVVDLANSPSFADADVLEFFETSGRNVFAAELEDDTLVPGDKARLGSASFDTWFAQRNAAGG